MRPSPLSAVCTSGRSEVRHFTIFSEVLNCSFETCGGLSFGRLPCPRTCQNCTALLSAQPFPAISQVQGGGQIRPSTPYVLTCRPGQLPKPRKRPQSFTAVSSLHLGRGPVRSSSISCISYHTRSRHRTLIEYGSPRAEYRRSPEPFSSMRLRRLGACSRAVFLPLHACV